MNIMEIKECPHGKHDAKCTKAGCVFQLDKWRGEETPTIEVEEHDGKFVIVCTDADEN